MEVLAQNKKVRHDYFILETYESGIVLQGTEIKSIRNGKVNIKDSYARIKNSEAFLLNMHISHYEHGNRYNHEETRERKLLLHKKEIIKLESKLKTENLTLIPTKIYLSKGFAKIELALCKGKKLHDKRQSLKEKDANLRLKKNLKQRY